MTAVRYDPLLARYLAEELDARLRGRRCVALPSFAPDLSVTLPLDGGEALRVDLHPERGWFRLVHAQVEEETLDAVCVGVTCPADERRIIIDLDVIGRFREQARSIVLELQTNQLNAVVVDRSSGAIVNVLRGRRAGDRSLFPGQPYKPPPPSDRFGVAEVREEEAIGVWAETLSFVPPEERRSRLIERFAYTGTLSARWIFQAPDARTQFERWWWLRSLPPAEPGLLRTSRGLHPYPVRLAGWEMEDTEKLLIAFQAVAALPAPEQAAPADADALEITAAERLVRHQLKASERKASRLRELLAASGDEAEQSREQGDMLLANLHLVRKGERIVRFEDWEGNPVEIQLDPELSPAENANRFYEDARRKQRAREQLPDLIASAEAEVVAWRTALEKVQAGEIPEPVQRKLKERGDRRATRGDEAPALPYRLFRTSGGIEVRVGRSSRDNDRLTFRESSPNDVWLHALSVPGSHVIMRWTDPEGAPPARDLEEAAQLAAVFSRARTSGLVSVGWTRRKYVRKPRGAAPGLVIPQRVKTILVEPDEGVVGRLAQ